MLYAEVRRSAASSFQAECPQSFPYADGFFGFGLSRNANVLVASQAPRLKSNGDGMATRLSGASISCHCVGVMLLAIPMRFQ
jgi:hypothetical protein